MSENTNWKILQIIQAQSRWTAVHCQESEDHDVKIFNRPIICWALVEALGETPIVRTQVRGIEQGSYDLVVVGDFINTNDFDGDGTDPNQYFLGYNDPEAHRESDYWIKLANERLRIERDKKLDKGIA